MDLRNCTSCGKAVWIVALPPGPVVCAECRKAKPKASKPAVPRICGDCGEVFQATRADQKYCPEHRRIQGQWPKRSGTQAKYRTSEHRAYTAQLKLELEKKGYLICTASVCVFPTRRITNPNGRQRDGLHAGHNDAGTAYDGPQHHACNVADAVRRSNARRRR